MVNRGFSTIVLGIVITVILLAGAGVLLWQQTKLPAVPAGEATPPPAASESSPAPAAQAGPVPASSNNDIWYRMRVEFLNFGEKSHQVYFPEFNYFYPAVLPGILNVLSEGKLERQYPRGYPSRILFDTTKVNSNNTGKPDPNNDYPADYFFALNPENSEVFEYKTYQYNNLENNLKITFFPLEPNLIPFLSSNEYCEKDSDCSIRHFFCTTGSYNHFDSVKGGYGCAGMYATEEDKRQCNLATEHPVVKYEGPICRSNKCAAQTRTVTCEEGAYQKGV